MIDDPIRAAEELANRILNPAAAEDLPTTTEEHAQYVIDLIDSGPKPITAEQQAYLDKADELDARAAKKDADDAADELLKDIEKPTAEQLKSAAASLRVLAETPT